MKNLIPARFYTYDFTRLLVSFCSDASCSRLIMRASALRSWKASWTDVRGAAPLNEPGKLSRH
jgi:hypothetical protein